MGMVRAVQLIQMRPRTLLEIVHVLLAHLQMSN